MDTNVESMICSAACIAAGRKAADQMQPAINLEESWNEAGGSQGVPEKPALREYEGRCCHICQCKYPSFGFGLPLTQKGQTIWACSEHQPAVDRMLTGEPVLHEKPEQTRLL
jgi:hypothetical protein